MAKEYIEREALIEEINSLSVTLCGKELFGELAKHSVTQKIDEQPTADVVEVKHGEWTECVYDGNLKCSLCEEHYPWGVAVFYRYCPNCGAKMDGEKP